jgi:uncharacterized protein (TIGR02466 family)
MKSVELSTIKLWPSEIYRVLVQDQIFMNEIKQVASSIIPDDVKKSNRGDLTFWRSNDLLHTLPEWQSLTNFILHETGKVLDQWFILRESYYITGLWLNARWQHQNHQPHLHANSLISGVFYLDVPEGSSHTAFFDPRTGSQLLKPRTSVPYSSGMVSVEAVEGVMLMWPSWLLHSTMSVTDKEFDRPRLSFGFNIMIRDDIDTPGARLNLT